jgi:beta-galactosidase
MMRTFLLPVLCVLLWPSLRAQRPARTTELFDKGWKFHLGDPPGAREPAFDDAAWRSLDLPHDWSIEGPFSKDHPAGYGGGALPGGLGWYRKTFTLPASARGKRIYIDFDGVYRNSDVWVNGRHLGRRPNGYISFRYDLTPHLRFGDTSNVMAVRVDNSQQPNSRWYSGSGIYRHVWLVTTGPVHVDHWGTYLTTPRVTDRAATVVIKAKIANRGHTAGPVTVRTRIHDAAFRVVRSVTSTLRPGPGAVEETTHTLRLDRPSLWSVRRPYLYRAITQVIQAGLVVDEYATPFGVRTFRFDPDRGFFLNGRPLRLYGVNQHHDLGALGAAVNTRAMERQLEILKAMGCNAIRTSHNPPAPELLDLCDRLGFVVIDEAFDMWKRPKTRFDYHLDWDEWHARDLADQVLRDRNHPSVVAWSVGNEVPEQWDLTSPSKPDQAPDTSGAVILRELKAIVRALDTTRPVTAGTDQIHPGNVLLRSGALDLIGYNYRHHLWKDAPTLWGRKPFIGSETASAFETRGFYEMPSDRIRRYPENFGRPGEDYTRYRQADYLASSYDNYSAGWGSTHEESLKEFNRLPFMAGTFVWTGFDYLGEPTPFEWPARSSYFGIVDLAGFPKDAYYLYQSLWTQKPVLHLLPHWNWTPGDTVDVWAYYSQADEVELFHNGRSLGTRRKTGDDLHAMWRTVFQPGSIRAVSRRNGKVILTQEVKTAGQPARMVLSADRARIRADGRDLSFVTVKIVDAQGTLVPDAQNLVQFEVNGPGTLAAVDNGSPISHEPFQAPQRKAFAGQCLAILRAGEKPGTLRLTARAEGLPPAEVTVRVGQDY